MNENGFVGVEYRVRVVHDMDPMISTVAADAIHNLHVALNHMWRHAIAARRNQRAEFPFFPTPERAKARFKGKEKGRVKQAVDLLMQADAFRVGNPFWQINCFNSGDKHEALRVVAGLHRGFQIDIGQLFATDFGPLGVPRVWHYSPPPDEITELKDGLSLLRIPDAVAIPYPDREIAFEVAFGKGEILEGEPAVPSVQSLTQAVDSLEKAFWIAKLLT